MPRLKKKEEPSPPAEASVTLTAGRSRRTIKPNRKYLNDSVVLATTSTRSSSPDSDASEDDYRQEDDDDEEVILPKSAAGRKSTGAAVAKKPVAFTSAPRPRGRPPKGVKKAEPVKNLRKEVLKKMDLSTLNMGKARVVLTPISKDIKRKLDLDASIVQDKTPVRGKQPEKQPEKHPEKSKPFFHADKTPVRGKHPEKQPEKPKPFVHADKTLVRGKQPEKQPEKPKPVFHADKIQVRGKQPERQPEKPRPFIQADKIPVRGKQPEKQPEKPRPFIQADKIPVRGKQPEKQPEKPKPKVVGKAKEPEKPEKEIPVPVKANEEKEKPRNLLFKRKHTEDSSPKQIAVDPKKFVNPVALQKQKVERSILDKRHRKPEGPSKSMTEDEDDDDVQIVGFGRETAPNVGRKSLRKSPLIAKQISPIAKKVIKPVAASKITPPPVVAASKITPPPVVAARPKRKAVADSGGEDSGHKAQTAKRGRTSKESRLSITLDSDDDYDDYDDYDDDEEEESEDEPVRRSTRSSLLSDKGSAASSSQNVSFKAKDSSAPNKLGKDSEATRGSMSKSMSLPALDKAKVGGRPLGWKPIQTPASKVLSKPMAQSTPKLNDDALVDKKSMSEVNLADPFHSREKESKGSSKNKSDQATIRIVSIGDILKKKAASTPDVRRARINRKSPPEEDYSSSDSDDSDDYFSPLSSTTEKPKTNNQLVATILERKRPINLDHLRINRPSKKGKPSVTTKQPLGEKPVPKASVINLTIDDEVDFEDMLQTNIVTANKVQKVVVNPTTMRSRGRLPVSSDENSSRPATKAVPLNKSPVAAVVKTLASNNNNVYKSNNNGRLGTSSTLNRSGSESPQKNPPRILNSTMKLGDTRPFAKLVANSGNKHYSIDLTDPDNNVKLISSPDSPPSSPMKRSPIKSVPRPIVASTGLRNTSNALNKPIGGAVQRSISALTSSSGSSPKMKKITCYETWYVINIPNTENKPERPSFAMSMIGLGNEAANVQLPSSEWSHKIILTKRKVLPSEGDEVFSGDVEDRAIAEEEKRNYEPCNIMFRRRTATPGKFNLQYDRAVIFKNDTFFINVDGKNCQLVGAPCKLYGTQDIETLLAVVDFVNLKNSCVELSAA